MTNLHSYITSTTTILMPQSNLIFIHFLVLQLMLPLLLKGYNDQSNKDVDEEKWKNNEVDDVENRHMHSIPWLRPFVSVGGVNRVS